MQLNLYFTLQNTLVSVYAVTKHTIRNPLLLYVYIEKKNPIAKTINYNPVFHKSLSQRKRKIVENRERIFFHEIKILSQKKKKKKCRESTKVCLWNKKIIQNFILSLDKEIMEGACCAISSIYSYQNLFGKKENKNFF